MFNYLYVCGYMIIVCMCVYVFINVWLRGCRLNVINMKYTKGTNKYTYIKYLLIEIKNNWSKVLVFYVFGELEI